MVLYHRLMALVPLLTAEGCATFVEEKDRIAVPIDTQILQR